MGITQPPPKEGAWSALFSNLSKSSLDNYVVKRSKRLLFRDPNYRALLNLIITQGLLSHYVIIVARPICNIVLTLVLDVRCRSPLELAENPLGYARANCAVFCS